MGFAFSAPSGKSMFRTQIYAGVYMQITRTRIIIIPTAFVDLFYFAAHVTLKPLVFLVGRVIARDVRLELTDRQTDRHTHTDQVL